MDRNTDLSPEALHARMLKKQLWIVMSKAMKPPEELRKQLKAHLELKSGSKSAPSCTARTRRPRRARAGPPSA